MIARTLFFVAIGFTVLSLLFSLFEVPELPHAEVRVPSPASVGDTIPIASVQGADYGKQIAFGKGLSAAKA